MMKLHYWLSKKATNIKFALSLRTKLKAVVKEFVFHYVIYSGVYLRSQFTQTLNLFQVVYLQ